MGSFAVIVIFIGFLIIGGLYWWVRQREQTVAIDADNMLGHLASKSRQSNNAIIVTDEKASLLHVSDIAREWLKLDSLEPTLEDVVAAIKPNDILFDLLANESSAAFEAADRWVEATSHFVPSPEGNRMVVTLRELKYTADATSADTANVMDVSTTMRILNEIGETVNASMGVEPVLQIVLEILNKAIPSDAGEVCIWDDRANFLAQRGWIGDTRYLLTVASLWLSKGRRTCWLDGRTNRLLLVVRLTALTHKR